MSLPGENDAELTAVAAEIKRLDHDGSRTAKVLRNTLDQLYDGQRTGRYKWGQLFKTEKTHCGTLVEINLQREFEFTDGQTIDYRIADIEVDCKYSQSIYAWMIPPEAHGHLCLLMWAEDSKEPRWSMGLVRITPACLRESSNRDGKTNLNLEGRKAITWLFEDAPLPPNVLLQLDEAKVERIMSLKSGQKRINELFRLAQGRIVGRGVIATVARQDDYMKRVRTNGGARTALKPEGIIILGQFHHHAAIAKALGVSVPHNGESISIRLISTNKAGAGIAKIDGQYWRIAQANDPVEEAPNLPKI
jgi:hypothetical protein